MTTLPAAAPSPSRRWKRVAVGAVVLAVVAVVLALFWKRWIVWPTWINAADAKEYHEKIVAEQDPDIVPLLLAGMKDSSKADDVRIACGRILIHEKNRGNEVERALGADEPLDVRRIAVRVLAGEPEFAKQYLADPAYGIDKTVLEWVSSPTAKSRKDAVQMMPFVWAQPSAAEPHHAPPEAIRALVEIVGGAKGVGSAAGELNVELRRAASLMLGGYRDCGSVPALFEAAEAESEPETQLRMLQALAGFLSAKDAPCAKELSQERLLALVERGLAHAGTSSADRAVRMGAMAVLRQKPEWVAKHAEALRKVVDAATEDVERREAFKTLVNGKDGPTLDTLARRFHDPYSGIRSSTALYAAGGAEGLKPADFASSMVGFWRDEVDAGCEAAFRQVSGRLWILASGWKGFPPRFAQAGPSVSEPAVMQALTDLFHGRDVDGVSRATIAEAWWRWLAKSEGVADGKDQDAAAAVRDAFWAKAKAGDAPGARAILEKAPAAGSKLWDYERGWLAAHSM